MLCPGCGTENRDQAKFCGACGTSLEETGPSAAEEVPVPGAETSTSRHLVQPGRKTMFSTRTKVLAVLVLLILAVATFRQTYFENDASQFALITRSGGLHNVIASPGRFSKTPFIDSVTYLNKEFEVDLLDENLTSNRPLTRDKIRLIVDANVKCLIVDPFLFYRTVRTERQAKSRTVDIMRSEMRLEIARANFAEIWQSDDDGLTTRIRASVAPHLRKFGIEITDMTINVRPVRP